MIANQVSTVDHPLSAKISFPSSPEVLSSLAISPFVMAAVGSFIKKKEIGDYPKGHDGIGFIVIIKMRKHTNQDAKKA